MSKKAIITIIICAFGFAWSTWFLKTQNVSKALLFWVGVVWCATIIIGYLTYSFSKKNKVK